MQARFAALFAQQEARGGIIAAPSYSISSWEPPVQPVAPDIAAASEAESEPKQLEQQQVKQQQLQQRQQKQQQQQQQQQQIRQPQQQQQRQNGQANAGQHRGRRIKASPVPE
jgi:hypothetical protein